jgi:hypothetical protein
VRPFLGDRPPSIHQTPVAGQARQAIIGDKNYGHEFEATLVGSGFRLRRSDRKGESERLAGRSFGPLCQIVESVNDTPKS